MQLDALRWQQQSLTCLPDHVAMPCCVPRLLQILAGAADREAILPYIKWFQTMIRWGRYSGSTTAVQRFVRHAVLGASHECPLHHHSSLPPKLCLPECPSLPPFSHAAAPLPCPSSALPLTRVSFLSFFFPLSFFPLRSAGGAPSL
jgi:hypothetical protein